MNRVILALVALIAIVSSQQQTPIKCVQCSSTLKGQEDCTETDSLAKYIKPCGKLTEGAFKGQAAIGCRKILQTVNVEDAVIRECAYSGEDVHAQRKTGNSGIKLFYYQCTSEDNNKPCNGGSAVFSVLSSSVLLAIAARIFA